MASAYATFAADGLYRHPHLVARVQTADGQVLYETPDDPGQRRFTEQVARNVTESMVNVASSSRIPLAGDRPVAAKTGTTENAVAGQNKDAWTIGYTPTLSTAVWVGTDDNSPIKTSAGRPIYGRMVPGDIWRGFMNAALAGSPVRDFGPFEPLGQPIEEYGYGDDEESDHGNHHGHHSDDGDGDSEDGDSEDGDSHDSDSHDSSSEDSGSHRHRRHDRDSLLGDPFGSEGG
jgi:membrane peptidoglycan carboxypeptidase